MTVKCSFTQYAINGFAVASPEMDDVATMIQKMQKDDLLKLGAPVYKISMNVTETINAAHFKHTAKSECDFYIADHIRTDTQINDDVRKQIKGIKSIPTPTGAPAILTNIHEQTYMAGGVRRKFSKPHPVSVGVNITWHVLDPNKDIVVDKNLHQIYPEKTGKFPVIIQKLLQNTK